MKNASNTATGAVGDLTNTGKDVAGAVGRRDIKGAASGVVKGGGRAVGNLGKGVSLSLQFSEMIESTDVRFRLARLSETWVLASTPRFLAQVRM
jgi:hypothetical protein